MEANQIMPLLSALTPVLTGIGVVLFRVAHVVEAVERLSEDFKSHYNAHATERSDTIDRLARLETTVDACPVHAPTVRFPHAVG